MLALILLAAGLSNLELRPGKPFALSLRPEPLSIVEGEGQPDSSVFEIVWRGLVFLFVLLLPFSIIHFIISPEARKRVLRDLLIMISFLIMYQAFVRAVSEGRVTLGQMPQAMPTPVMPSTPVRTEFTASPPEWLVIFASLGVAALLVGVLFWAGWYLRRRQPENAVNQLAKEAQHTLQVLHAGGDFKNAVVRCYAEMSRVLSERRGLERQPGMTPREFERRLAQVGLPREDVRRLTRLFEDARYGATPPGEKERREAEACLTAIARAAGGIG